MSQESVLSQATSGEEKKLIVGLTGGIGSGKSTVAAMFSRHGAGIVDTDAIAYQVTQPGGESIPAILAAFGDGYVTDDGALDRAKMRALIFSDAAAKRRLEEILHPTIFELAKKQLRGLQGKPYVIVVVPLLPESRNFRQLVQRVLVVDCDEDTQAARVIARSGLTDREVRAIIAQQTPRVERLKLADEIISNAGGLDRLEQQVAVLDERYRKIPSGN